MASSTSHNSSASQEFQVDEMTTWPIGTVVGYWLAVVIGQELIHYIIVVIGNLTLKRIPESGKFLEKFTWKDWLFVYINRLSVPILVFNLFQFVYRAKGHVEWDMGKITLLNTAGSLAGFFILYDLLYVPFHGFLHLRFIYPWIHKHHHRNAAPARGNLDASNTHPVEFILGEYIHLVCVWAIPSHIVAVFIFLAFGGLLASLNHTRLDLHIPGFYNVRAHDKHHHIPTVNYGQYTMLWDKVASTFQESTKPAIILNNDNKSK